MNFELPWSRQAVEVKKDASSSVREPDSRPFRENQSERARQRMSLVETEHPELIYQPASPNPPPPAHC